MAFTQEEKQMLINAKNTGLSKEQALGRVIAQRGTPTPTQEPTKLKNFAVGAVDAFSTPGRGIQTGLSKLTDTLTGTTGFGAPIQDKTERAASLGADAGAESFRAGEIAGFVGELLIPAGGVARKAGTEAIQAAPKVLEAGVEGVSKVKEELASRITKLDDKTKTALQRTERKELEDMLKIAEDASKNDQVRTPLERVGDSVIDSLRQVKDRASQVGAQKEQLLEQANVGFNKVGNAAQKTALDIQKLFTNKKLSNAESKFIKEVQDQLKGLGDNPRLKDVDATIDLIQDKIYTSGRQNVIEVTDRVTGPIRSQIGKLNGKMQDLGGEAYKAANKEYADMIKFANELNARLGKEGASAGSFVKRLFSPSDARTKELFEQLQDMTNKDFFKDARLAKFSMEVFGDTRAASLLEQVPRTTGGFVERAFDFVVDKLTDPAAAAKRFIDKQR